MSENNTPELYNHLLQREQAAERRAEQAEERCAFLTRVSTLLAEPSNSNSTLRNVADAVVPFLADYCLIHWFEPDGALQQFTVCHRDIEQQSLVESLAPCYSKFLENLDCLIARSLRSQVPYVASTVSRQLLETFLYDSQSQTLLNQLSPCSMLLIPLVAQGRCFGLLTLAMSTSNRCYDAPTVSVAQDLARWTALAIHNAQLHEKAQETNRLKQEFLAAVSHELRTPLHAILGWTHILRNRTINESMTQLALETIDRRANDQLRLVYDLLDVSRIFTGKLRLKSECVDLETIVYEAIAQLRLAAQSKSIQVTAQIDEVKQVLGDQRYLRQIIWHLLSNAIKFTPNNGQVTINLTRSNQVAQIQIRDTGEGIEPAFLPHVFDRFRQADGGSARSHQGLGLGLALVYYLVELHGGTVQVDSPGKGLGATFTVQLPIPPLPCVSVQNVAAPDDALGFSRSRLEGLELILVEFESSTREWLTMYLEEEGATVTALASVRKALTLLAQRPIDGLICAIGTNEHCDMQLTTGLQQWQRKNNRTMPAIALLPSEFSILDPSERAFLPPVFQNSLFKPIEPDELIAVVASTSRSPAVLPESTE